jgi:hypothetical protein
LNTVLRIQIRDPVFFYPPDPGFGSEIWDEAMVGSGISKQNLLIAFIQKEVGSGIRDTVLFYPPDPGWSNGRIRIRDKTSRIRNTG